MVASRGTDRRYQNQRLWRRAVFGTGGTLNLTLNGTGALGAGYKANGSLLVADGTVVASTNGILGRAAGSSGVATVTGACSTWANSADLYVGIGGSGTLTVSDGGLVSARTLYASSSDLHGNGTITASGGAVLDADLVFDATHGTTQVLPFGTGGRLNLTVDGGDLGVGYKGRGTLRIADGAMVTSRYGYLGRYTGSTATATVSGAGSQWTNKSDIYVGGGGTATLSVEAGGQVVIGAGVLDVGNRGTLIVTDGGKVSTLMLQLNFLGRVCAHVSGNDMLVLGTATTKGSMINKGTVSFYADASLPAGTYTPVSPYPGKTISWSGTGTYNAFGGTWDANTKTFSVAEPTALLSGDTDTITSGERLLFTDELTGERVGASFGSITGSVNFSAAPMNAADLANLAGLLEEGRGVLSAWDFTTNVGNSEVLLSFDIGSGAEELSIWRCRNGAWSSFSPTMMTYDTNGIASFTVYSFGSGYAVTAAVPEPGTMGLMALAGSMLLARRRR